MEEKEVRLFFKDKIAKRFYLVSYIFLGLFGIIFTLVSGIGLIVENGNASSIYLYICLGFGIVSLVMAIITICLALFHNKEGLSTNKFNLIMWLKMFLRVINFIGALILLIGSFAGSIGFDVQNEHWGNFIRIFAIFLMIIEATMALYSAWKIAWRKENPERYAPGLVVKKREKPKYTAEKVEKEETIKENKANNKQIEQKKENKEVIKAIEVKDEKKKK